MNKPKLDLKATHIGLSLSGKLSTKLKAPDHSGSQGNEKSVEIH